MLEQFEFEIPTKVCFGKGVIDKASAKLRGFGKKCFLVTGRTSAEKYGYLKKMIGQLDNAGIKYVHCNKISPNPKSTECDKAGEVIRKEKCDFVLALGGGSVMDAAKAIAMLAVNDGPIWDYVYKGPGKKFKSFNNALPIVMVPTFAATGSEMNQGAVISDPQTSGKTPFFGHALYPKLTIIDPELTYTVPYHATVDGAVDIICHVMEMYLSKTDDDYLQDQLSIAIVKIVKRSLDILKTDLKNYEARAQFFWAASLALSGITTVGGHGAWPMHAVEHVLSGHCDKLAHGRGLATIFLKILEVNKDKNAEKIISLSRQVFEKDYRDVDAAIKVWIEWFNSHETGGSLADFIDQDKIEEMAEQVLQFSGTPDFLPNIQPFYKDDLVVFIKSLI